MAYPTFPARCDGDLEIFDLTDLRAQTTEEALAAIARQLNGPVAALLIYMNEIKQRGELFLQAGEDRLYLHQVIENALRQTERVCAIVKLIASPREGSPVTPDQKVGWKMRPRRAKDICATPMMLSSESDKKPLTIRECEVLSLIVRGYSSKQGALQMGISHRTFESHRYEAMRKLGARNTADLVREAILHLGAV
jgi:DNA-binding CsgD family transcriptional regulator